MLILSVHDLFQGFLFLNLAQSQIAFEEVEVYHVDLRHQLLFMSPDTITLKMSLLVLIQRGTLIPMTHFLNCYLFCCLHTLETLESYID